MSPVTSSSHWLKLGRWMAMIVSIVNVLMAAATLFLMWQQASPLLRRIDYSIDLGSALLVAGVIFLIAWRGGDQLGNLLIALAFAFAGANTILYDLVHQLPTDATIRNAVNLPTFILGAGFFILAAARFPQTLVREDIASSHTIWGRIKPLRAILIFFLRPSVVWAFIVITSIVIEPSDNRLLQLAHWVSIVLLGTVYFYINYRSGDLETRRKVLWFFELTLSMLVINLVWNGVFAVLPANTQNLRIVLSIMFMTLYTSALVFCLCMAVFYAGAISPALVIRKTFVYGVTVALLLFIYATLEAFVANLLVDKMGISNGFANAMLGTVLALAFHPIKNKMESGLRRFSPRENTVPQN